MRPSERNRARRLGHAAAYAGTWWTGGEIVTPYRSPALRRVWLAAYARANARMIAPVFAAMRCLYDSAIACFDALAPIFARLAG